MFKPIPRIAPQRSLLVAAALLLTSFSPALHAAEIVNFAWTGTAGYSATGSFIFDPTTAPAVFSEAPGAVGLTKYLQNFSISFFNQSSKLLEIGDSIVNGSTSDRFFRLDYNSNSRTITNLDADIGGPNYQYFLTDLRDPGGNVVPPGVTGFNLFFRPNGTPFLDSAASVQVTSVAQTPEPATSIPAALALLAFAFTKRLRDRF